MPTAQESLGQLHTNYAAYMTPSGTPSSFQELVLWTLKNFETNDYRKDLCSRSKSCRRWLGRCARSR